MKPIISLLAILILLPTVSAAEEIDARYKQLVDKVLEVTGALKVGEQMSAFMVAEMTNAMRKVDEDLPDRAYEVLETEVNLVIRQEVESGSFNEMMYPIYRKYLDAGDLEATIEFYQSTAGRKIASVMPQLSQEAMIAGQSWGARLGPKVANRVRAKLSEEGIEFP